MPYYFFKLKLKFALTALICVSISYAEEQSLLRGGTQNEAMVFYLENDSRNIGGPGSDQAYSSGFKISYISAQNRAPAWSKKFIENIQIIKKEVEKSKTNFSLSLGHQIYTPQRTQVRTLIDDDRPYGAWLYVGFAASLKKEDVSQAIELDIGSVGPNALGKEVQNNVHDLLRNPHSEGWRHGLRNELTLQVFLQQQRKIYQTENLEVLPYYGLGLGNVLTGAHGGSLIRFGVHLPDDFGPSRPSGSQGDSFITPENSHKFNTKKSYYIFAGGRVNAIARNIFLDGNTFVSSHRVKKYPFTFETEFGAGLQIFSYGVVWRFVTRSPEFEEKSVFNSFASVSLVYYLK